MLNWKKNLFIIWISQFLSIAAFSSSLTFIPFYIQKLGVADDTTRNMYVAQFMAMGAISFCLMSPVWGFIADVYGRRLMLLRSNFVSAFLMPLMAFAPNVSMLLLLRFLIGAFSGTVTASQTLIASTTPVKNRGFALGTISSALFSGSMAGMFFGGLIVDKFGYTVTFLVTGALLLISGLLVLFGVEDNFRKTLTLKEKLAEFKFRPPKLGSIWFILFLLLLMGFARQFEQPFLPVLVEKINGLDRAATWTGIIASITAVAGIISGSLLGWLADKTSAPRVAVWSALLSGVLMLPQAMAQSLLLLGAARFGMVFFAGGLDPVFQIWLSKCTPDDKRGIFFGWASSAKTLGWVLAALCSGSVAIFAGVRWVFIASGIIYILLIPIIKFSAGKIHPQS
ncbi:MAG: MFS transporter [Victivallaceae bacterium]|nr:MFS transporter [Victivallaceae bacterium]